MSAPAITPSAPSSAAAPREFSSFRDPSGFLFWQDGTIYRWIEAAYVPVFRRAEETGLLAKATRAGLLLPFETAPADQFSPEGADPAGALVLKPRQLSLLTYPYEWSFSQLQDAALTTLDLHLLALDHGMLLKDASAFNIQFVDGRATLIDHLSFDPLEGHSAWPAYGQFCRHFLAPLLLMSYVDLSLGRLLQVHLDGIPLDLASRLLPRRTRLSPAIQMHLHLHGRMTQKYADERKKVAVTRTLSAAQHKAIAGSLKRLIAKLKPKAQFTEWGDYYNDTNYSSDAFDAKKAIIRDYVTRVAPRTLWDLGGNNGEMSRAVRDLAGEILCVDIDPRAVDLNYRQCRKERITNIVPALSDLTNPTPALGFFNRERKALFERTAPDLAMALALFHHLAIGNNLPLPKVAAFLAAVSGNLIIEFVPKSDSQVKRLLANRPDIFPDYTQEGFERAFTTHFDVVERRAIPGTERILYLMARKPG
ncbi:hypothetical protein [Hyphomicrobium sp. CS1GBMeth3]|uniref:hypothetical protein n=1 Tax=Hyphomicrobium sp. CS1GBMeth3 TaxID=1892845 RepID=UPI000930DA0F|nr:hypothetical protein [Hyphomicrobium sp. CS1GBMeth3]